MKVREHWESVTQLQEEIVRTGNWSLLVFLVLALALCFLSSQMSAVSTLLLTNITARNHRSKINILCLIISIKYFIIVIMILTDTHLHCNIHRSNFTQLYWGYTSYLTNSFSDLNQDIRLPCGDNISWVFSSSS